MDGQRLAAQLGRPWGILDMVIATAPGFIAATPQPIVVTLLASPPLAKVAKRFDRVEAGESALP